jgi:hypothetical protein
MVSKQRWHRFALLSLGASLFIPAESSSCSYACGGGHGRNRFVNLETVPGQYFGTYRGHHRHHNQLTDLTYRGSYDTSFDQRAQLADARRLALPDSAFIKEYHWPQLTEQPKQQKLIESKATAQSLQSDNHSTRSEDQSAQSEDQATRRLNVRGEVVPPTTSKNSH